MDQNVLENTNQNENNAVVDDREVVVKVEHLSMKFNQPSEKIDNLKEYVVKSFGKNKVKKEKFVALDDINFEVKKGDRVGIFGLNGAGKSTLLKALVGVYQPTSGNIKIDGVVAPLLEVGAGFDPNYTGRENIYLYGSILGFSREFLEEKEEEIVKFSELGKHIDKPVKNYSSGMRSRLGFSIATAVQPEILILDEVLSVGDAKFRSKSLAKVNEMFDSGVTVLFVSHNISQVRNICNRAILLEEGKIVEDGDVDYVSMVYNEKTGGKVQGLPLDIMTKEQLEKEYKNCQARLARIEKALSQK